MIKGSVIIVDLVAGTARSQPVGPAKDEAELAEMVEFIRKEELDDSEQIVRVDSGPEREFVFYLEVHVFKKTWVKAHTEAEAIEIVKDQIENGADAGWQYHQPGEVKILNVVAN